MESRNPAFSRRGAFGAQRQAQGHSPSPQQLQDMYNAPSYAPPATRTMTVDDVVVRGFLMLGTLVIAGALAWVLDPPPIVAIGSLIVGMVFWAIMTFGNKANA
ncbi:MAG: Bax inhibitor-1/YccA family membrane protein, partial [Actinomadura sp.]